MRNLAVDLGNYNIKTSEGIIFPSRYTTDEQVNKLDEQIITFDGVDYAMEKGDWDNEYNKVEKHYIPNLLYAIARSTSATETINLIIGVPIAQISLKDKFKDDLEGKTFKYSYNGSKRQITLNKVGVVAEGVSSYYSLTDSERKQEIMIVDIGGRTINAVSFVNKKVENKKTIPLGMINFYSTIADREASKGENYTDEEIERLINNNTITDIDTEKQNFLSRIINVLKKDFKLHTYQTIYFTGGGAKVLESSIKNSVKVSYKVIPNPLFSNCMGNLNIANVKWSE